MTWNQRPRGPQQQHGFDLIGTMIKRRRQSLGWTQRFLEAQSKIDQTVISRIENGKQYGLRWSRFADLVASLDGLDSAPAARPWPPPRAQPPEPLDEVLAPVIDRVIDLAGGLEDEGTDER